jgi:F-type H+-transporting ATPase subunit a
MEHGQLLIGHWVNALLDPVLLPLVERFHWLERFGLHATPGHVIPDYLVISALIVVAWAVFGLIVRSRLSVEHPSRAQVVLELIVTSLAGLLDDWIGPKGRRFMPLVGALGAFILIANYAGLVPGLMAPTSNMSVPAGCAITIWVYYHFQGVREQGLVKYILHFAVPPGSPWWLFPLMIIIEPISHLSRAMSLTLRLFGNIFGEEMVIAILAMLAPFLVPLPMMVLGLVTGSLQAFIFVLLSVVYLQGAVVVEHHDERHAEAHGGAHPAAAAA